MIIPKYFDPIVIPPTGGYEMRPLGFAVAILISVAACSPPRPLEHPRPQYPDMLSAAKLGGTVIARLNVDRRGRVRSITVDSATHAHALFRVSARNALRSARFHPARWFGIAHPGSFRYSIQYVLAERGPAGSASPARSSVDSLAGCPHARSDSDLVVCAVPVVRRADIQ